VIFDGGHFFHLEDPAGLARLIRLAAAADPRDRSGDHHDSSLGRP
jgi:hypothetical protein